MATQPSPDWQAPSGQRLALSVVAALAVAAIVLVTAVLPAEYGIDPTGVGRLLGLTELHQPARTLEVKDVIGGNERVREVEIPEPGQPTPLPNPAVHQDESAPPKTATVTLTLDIDQETEIKAVMREAKVLLYSWHADGGMVYSDFHGHDPSVSSEAFVRYREDQEAAGGDGSLVAPFGGEHGWYWKNVSNNPVTVTLNLTGYFDDTKDYGIH
ncbi:MAG TPA: hypothetical protein VHH11_04875 [Gammaproteobacteria bacterium]|nr:hypothetical protein [Gammaproteobacteria bacterium]